MASFPVTLFELSLVIGSARAFQSALRTLISPPEHFRSTLMVSPSYFPDCRRSGQNTSILGRYGRCASYGLRLRAGALGLEEPHASAPLDTGKIRLAVDSDLLSGRSKYVRNIGIHGNACPG